MFLTMHFSHFKEKKHLVSSDSGTLRLGWLLTIVLIWILTWIGADCFCIRCKFKRSSCRSRPPSGDAAGLRKAVRDKSLANVFNTSTLTDRRFLQDDFPSLRHNMQYSLFCQRGVFVMEGRMFSLRCVGPPTQCRCVWMGFRSLVVLRTGGRTKQLKRVSGTNQNICFVKFTFTDCLVEFSLSSNSDNSRKQACVHLSENKGTFRFKQRCRLCNQQVQ